jgi:hypothetical protein
MKKENLHNITSSGFKTPTDYFETFDENLIEKINAQNSIKNIENTGFKVPQDYFDTVEDSILNTLKTKDETPVISLKSRKSFYYIAGIAASLFIMFAVFVNTNTTEELSIEMVETYFENEDFNTYELAQLLADTNVLDDDFTITETNYNEENLEEYLLENTDIEFILD